MKNIIFDLGSVILKNRASSVLDELNIDSKTYHELKRFFHDCIDLDLGKMTLEEKYLDCHFKDDNYKDYLIHYYKYRKINMDLINMINKLKANNYNIYILSDNNKECINYYKNNELFKSIDYWVVSCDYHALKEDGKLFDIFLDKYHLNPHECYFIDDKKININEANKRNIKGYIFNEEEDINFLYKDMRNNGINI